jgi:hypothetical protein
VAAELVEHGALCRQNPPVRLLRCVGAAEHFERLVEMADIGKRTAIGPKQRRVVGLGKRCLFQDRYGLGALAARTQSPRIGKGGLRIVRVGAVALAKRLGLASPLGLRLRCRAGRSGRAGRAGRIARPDRFQDVGALAARYGERNAERRENGRPVMAAARSGGRMT